MGSKDRSDFSGERRYDPKTLLPIDYIIEKQGYYPLGSLDRDRHPEDSDKDFDEAYRERFNPSLYEKP